MAGITLAQAQARLDLWMDADAALTRNQRYRIGERELTRADARTVRENIEYWDRAVRRLARGGIRVRGVTPI